MKEVQKLYQGKKVLILGLGVNQGGVGAAKFFAQAGAKVKVTDLKTKGELQPSLDQLKDFSGIEYTFGEHRFEDLDWADLIIRNPAVKPDNQYLKYAFEQDKQVEMDLGIFLQFVSPSQIIGVTGTKGKSTTASLIYEILKTVRKKVVLAGNIQASVLETLPKIDKETLVILELSSFQLQAFEQHKFSPKWAVITNIYPDHLNYHKSMEEYVEIKKAIARYQNSNDYLFLNKDNEITGSSDFAGNLPSRITYFQSADLPQDFVSILPGQHNLSNMAAALAVTTQLGINQTLSLSVMKKFKGIRFRLQLIKEINGIKIYNDSASTNPTATIQALQSLPGSILIVGGMNKGMGYQELTEAINQHAKTVYFLEGDATEEIKKKLVTANRRFMQPGRTYNNLEKLLLDVKSISKHGDIILFSPGATSFNLFQNEFDRGEQFNQAIEKIF